MPPLITSTSGAWTHGGSVTISGSSFGSKGGTNPNKPLIWADFEASIQPTSLGHLTAWSQIIGDNTNLSTAAPQHGLSTQNVKGTYNATSGNSDWHNFALNRAGLFTGKIYGYAKRYYDFARPSNQKLYRLWTDQLSPNLSLVGIVHSGDTIMVNEFCLTDPDAYPLFGWLQNQWGLEEFFVDIGTVDGCGGNNGNGMARLVRNGVTIQQDLTMSYGVQSGKTYGRLWWPDNFNDTRNPPAGGDSVYMDDIYIDDTWARAMIGNTSTFATSTQREIQIPSVWADGSVTVTVNRGNFGATANAWLYVVDSTGASNVSGFPIAFGGSDPDPRPTARMVRIQ